MAVFGHPGQRLRDLRQAFGLTQQQLAVHLGTQQATVSDWENGVSKGERGFRGWLRLAADLCVNDREVFQWLDQGGRRPEFLSILNGAGTWRDERRVVADRLRKLADELDPPDPLSEALGRSLRDPASQKDVPPRSSQA